MDLDDVKARMAAEIDRRAEALVDVSHRIHERPELNFEERHAHDLLCEVLETEGVATERHAFGLETAFAGRAGSGGPAVAVCLEYDALPGIGHACGHNVIAAAGLGAGLAAAALADDCGGRVVVGGTPAEEGGGGKVLLIRAGAFDGVDAAMMVHPAGAELRAMSTIAVQQVIATYHGEAAHAAAAPHQGRNALDAAVLGYNAVAALRQHIRDGERIHGVFTDGGDKPNIVPARAETHWYVRSPTVTGREELVRRVERCLVAGADAAGCEVELSWVEPPYSDMIDNQAILEAYVANMTRLGRRVLDPAETEPVVGSTDMGDVSYVVPSIHPMVRVADGVPIHSERFADAARSPAADAAVVDAAKAMAFTVADLWLGPGLLSAAGAEHERSLAGRR